MKNAFFALAVLLGLTTAQAASLTAFTGKYSPRNCTIEGSRAYVSLAKDRSGRIQGLNLNFYGDDAALIELTTRRSVTENPNFQFGNPVKTIIVDVDFDGVNLTNTITHLDRNGRKSFAGSQTLQLSERGLRYFETDQNHMVTERCILDRQ
ncbi:MAG TPA: hypothetical protein VFV50_00795 [Bdellovibrionales bacterium]|nr:hypothetical protein [Bdellovibrionales bacterium]